MFDEMTQQIYGILGKKTHVCIFICLFCARNLFPPNKASAQTKGRSHWIKVAQNQKLKKLPAMCGKFDALH